MERVRIETGSKAPAAAGGTAWSASSTETRWCECVFISAEKRERYQSIDGQVDYEFRFHDWPTITMAGSRFVWVTDGHPNALKIFYPVKPPQRMEGQRRATVVLVKDSGETADE